MTLCNQTLSGSRMIRESKRLSYIYIFFSFNRHNLIAVCTTSLIYSNYPRHPPPPPTHTHTLTPPQTYTDTNVLFRNNFLSHVLYYIQYFHVTIFPSLYPTPPLYLSFSHMPCLFISLCMTKNFTALKVTTPIISTLETFHLASALTQKAFENLREVPQHIPQAMFKLKPTSLVTQNETVPWGSFR